jgi:VCBS repeat-containing protein
MGAGGSCSISVTFTPTATGSRTATLTVTDSNAGNSGQTVALSGTGVVLAGTIALTPGSLTFSGQLTDTLSTAQAVTLQNSGTAALAVPSVSISGANAGDFGLTNGCQSTLGVGSTCTIAVTFTPAASGSRTATLTVIDSNASNSPQTLALSGTGVAAVGTIALTPASLTFSSQTTGTTSTAQTVTVQNTGTAALAVPSVSISGSNANDFGLSNGCHASLSVGSSCVISLTFTPAATGSRTATLTVADSNASNSLQTVVLNGTGQDFSLSAATSSIVAITAGQSAAATVAVSAVDGFTGSITFTCAVPAAMTEASCSAAPVQIASGASSANSTVTINTTAAHHVSALRRHSSWIVAQWSLGFFGVFLWGIPCRRRKRIAFGAVLLATLLLSACGGGSGGGASSNSSGYTDTGTPAGTYVLTLTASSGAASHTMTLSATVQ